MRLGQIGGGRQNPPIQSAELASSRISMAKGMPSTSLQDWKAVTAPLLPQKRRGYDAGGFPYRSACTKQPRYAPGCLYPSRWLPWLRRCAQRTQVCLKLMIIRVNFDRTSINESQVSGIYLIHILTNNLRHTNIQVFLVTFIYNMHNKIAKNDIISMCHIQSNEYQILVQTKQTIILNANIFDYITNIVQYDYWILKRIEIYENKLLAKKLNQNYFNIL
ncbi:Hypothetical_protein [Hexamita inflata]|uniref:Hypothetical_protein n=1 Tax=Hexamita inflata TaxID=28002 RepID=A0AA86U457_9EUKA|nr:Hypothetical protein HINF_LOCUS17778 [Hexamita inflata]